MKTTKEGSAQGALLSFQHHAPTGRDQHSQRAPKEGIND